MFDDTVTFYSYDADTESWKRTVIAGCQWSAETVKRCPPMESSISPRW